MDNTGVGHCTMSVPSGWAEESKQWQRGHGNLHYLRGDSICLKGDKVGWKSNFYSFMCSSVKGDNFLNWSIHDPFKARGRNLGRKAGVSLITSITLKIKYFQVFLEHQNFNVSKCLERPNLCPFNLEYLSLKENILLERYLIADFIKKSIRFEFLEVIIFASDTYNF